MPLPSSGPISLQAMQNEFGGTMHSSACRNTIEVVAMYMKQQRRYSYIWSSTNGSFPWWCGCHLTKFLRYNKRIQKSSTDYRFFLHLIWRGSYYPIRYVRLVKQHRRIHMIVNIPCTIINYGRIIGKGGNGGSYTTRGYNGGAAMRITSSGVTIQNMSGAFIAGGGGGGGGGSWAGVNNRAGGGAGAGGGNGGNGSFPYYYNVSYGGSGGAINGTSTGTLMVQQQVAVAVAAVVLEAARVANYQGAIALVQVVLTQVVTVMVAALLVATTDQTQAIQLQPQVAAVVGAHVVALAVSVPMDTAARQLAKQQAIHCKIAEQFTEARNDYKVVLRLSRV